MGIKDILGIGKILPIDKLIDVLSSSVGRLSKPYFDRKDIDTKVYEIRKIAEARADEMKIISKAVKENSHLTGGIEYKEEKLMINSPKESSSLSIENLTLEERAKDRVEYQEVKKQINVENIAAFAADELKDEPSVSDEPLDEDWTTRFFRIAEDISSEEMQALWGKILAGEVKQPKSYSLRTLELVRNLSKKEADTFMRIASFAIISGNKSYVFKGNDEDKLSKEFGVTYSDIALLREIGLMQPGDFVSHQFLQKEVNSQRILIAGNVVLAVDIKANNPTLSMPVHVFSNTGNELLKLVKPMPTMDYLKYFANSIKSQSVEVRYANILSWQGDSVRHTLPLQDL